jgi:hypothetical protein
VIEGTTDARNLQPGQIVVLTYDYDYDTKENSTIGVILQKQIDAFGIDTYLVYWFQRGKPGDHYWFHLVPVTLEEYEDGLYYDYFHSPLWPSER